MNVREWRGRNLSLYVGFLGPKGTDKLVHAFLCPYETHPTVQTRRAIVTIMLHIGSLIHEELKRQRRSAAWLAEQLYCDRTNVYRLFRRSGIDTEMLFRISRILDHDFFRHFSEEIACLSEQEIVENRNASCKNSYKM